MHKIMSNAISHNYFYNTMNALMLIFTFFNDDSIRNPSCLRLSLSTTATRLRTKSGEE